MENVIGKCPVVVVCGVLSSVRMTQGYRRIHHHRGILQESPAATGTCDVGHHRMYLLTAANGTGCQCSLRSMSREHISFV